MRRRRSCWGENIIDKEIWVVRRKNVGRKADGLGREEMIGDEKRLLGKRRDGRVEKRWLRKRRYDRG